MKPMTPEEVENIDHSTGGYLLEINSPASEYHGSDTTFMIFLGTKEGVLKEKARIEATGPSFNLPPDVVYVKGLSVHVGDNGPYQVHEQLLPKGAETGEYNLDEQTT